MSNISLTDVATTQIAEDTLGIATHAQALSEFIQGCATPITIGVQGEWGSGKTSLLNLVIENLENREVKKGRGTRTGKEAYKTIWINTWEHSLLKSPEETMVSILAEIADQISQSDGSYEMANKVKGYLGQIAKGALRVGASATLGGKGAEIAEELLGTEDNSIKKLRTTLQQTVTNVIERNENPIERFVIFVDDLDRLNPENAVQVLELLKNIFSIDHCVFVLAIDYQVVVKGLRHKFGEMTEENEWEFRAFFDKIIQMPFMMPMASYDMHTYIENLLTGVEYFSKREFTTVKYLTKTIQATMGNNPRALKRLVNSLSLINMYWKLQQRNTRPIAFKNGESDYLLKSVMLVLVCIQISYPKIYDLLSNHPDFLNWNEDLVAKLTKGEHEDDKELQKAYAHAVHHDDPDFDEEWEQALFKIVWFKRLQRGKVANISRILSVIKDDILTATHIEHLQEVMEFAIQITAVTSVITSIENNNDNHEEDAKERRQRMSLWANLKRDMIKHNIELGQAMKSNILSMEVRQKHEENSNAEFFISLRASSYMIYKTNTGDEGENYQLFKFFRENKEVIENAVKAKVKFKLSEEKINQSVLVIPPQGLPNRGQIDKAEKEVQDKYLNSIIINYPRFIDVITELTNRYNDTDQSTDEGTPEQVEEDNV